MWKIIPRSLHGIPVAFAIMGPARKGDTTNQGWQVLWLHVPLYGWWWLVERYLSWRYRERV